MKIPNKINPIATLSSSLNTNEFKFEFSNQIYTAYFIIGNNRYELYYNESFIIIENLETGTQNTYPLDTVFTEKENRTIKFLLYNGGNQTKCNIYKISSDIKLIDTIVFTSTPKEVTYTLPEGNHFKFECLSKNDVQKNIC